MAVVRIEEFKQQNGVSLLKVFTKPTAKFPFGGYFYAPVEAVELVQNFTWFLSKSGNRVEVIATAGDNSGMHTVRFHKELFKYYHNFDWKEVVDHINHVETDNTDINLNAIFQNQNALNRYVRGYDVRGSIGRDFNAECIYMYKHVRPYKMVHREDEACSLQNYLEQVTLRELMKDDFYQFDFLKYRRDSEDILDLERTGKIGEEEATYRHILRYAENTWYYLRYGLQDFFRDYGIPVPKYSLDDRGFMIHQITGQKLCPFY